MTMVTIKSIKLVNYFLNTVTPFILPNIRTTIMNLVLALLCCNTCGLFNSELNDNPSPKVVIVGGGTAGIAAATKLLENGITDITILEAEQRIGGRVHSINFGDYMVDMGAQWVHGEKNNVVFELAWPLGLLERMKENYDIATKFYGSPGFELSFDISNRLSDFGQSIVSNLNNIGHLETGSLGEYAELRFIDFFKTHPEIREDLYEPIFRTFDLGEMTMQGADSWYDVSVRGMRQAATCEGDQSINWKNLTYSIILDILMKKYPHPEEELPVLKMTKKNSKVTKINYNKGYENVKVLTADGKEYLADHVIFTPSLGVLKANHQQLFDPPLPQMKVNAIENIGFGHVAKIWLYYDDPWWKSDGEKFMIKPIFWSDKDMHEMECDSERRWMLGVYAAVPVEHKPKLLCLWMSSNYSIEMESIPEEIFRNQTLTLLNLFYGSAYNITEPTDIIRTTWNTNENFRGTYSYPSISADLANVSFVDLAEPITLNDKPILQFAGEATSEHYSTVHGAIDSGWREADRLIDLYKKNDLSMLLKKMLQQSTKNIYSLNNYN